MRQLLFASGWKVESPRVLVNEWLACSIGRVLGLTIPKPVILTVPEEFVERDPSPVVRLDA